MNEQKGIVNRQLIGAVAESEEEYVAREMRALEAYMTERFAVWGKVGAIHVCPTGEPYVMFGIGGEKQQGEPFRVFTSDVPKAIEMFKAEFDKYSEGKDGVIYWRRKPEVSVEFCNGTDGPFRAVFYRLSARFCISDKPRLTTKEE